MASAEDALRKGLKAAADRFARAMRQVAGLRTRQTAENVNIVERTNEVLIRGGRPGGAWDWEPIQALMFDNNLRHPLFGDRKHWYKQGRFPITQMTERMAIESSTEAFADAFVPDFVRNYGFDK